MGKINELHTAHQVFVNLRGKQKGTSGSWEKAVEKVPNSTRILVLCFCHLPFTFSSFSVCENRFVRIRSNQSHVDPTATVRSVIRRSGSNFS